jgi:SAM-dependent methyltransferase
MTATTCPLCGCSTFEPVLRVDRLPKEEGYFADTAREAAAAAVGSIALHHCTTCGLVHDSAPRHEDVTYEPGYTTFMGHSPSFARHVAETAEHLVARHGLTGGTVVDIACGFGDFLHALLDAGMSTGVGIDPAAAEQSDERLQIVRKYFEPNLLPDRVDLVSCRHMLYLLDDPTALLRSLRVALHERDTVVYLELMNQGPVLAGSDPWDVTYEHRSYFTEQSARRLLALTGFDVIDVRTVHHDRFLAVEARPGPERVPEPGWDSELTPTLAGLQDRAEARIRAWREALADTRRHHGRVVAWCAGARAIAFLALAEAGDEVAAVVDVSPARQGRYVPGSARPVVDPTAVRELAPQVILVTNQAYTGEIRDSLAEMGLETLPVIELDDPRAPDALVAATVR